MAGNTAESGRGAAAQSWRRALELTAPIAQNPSLTFPLVIERLAGERAAAPALLSDRQTLTYGELAARADHYANWALNQRLAAGDVVCLMMPNCLEYLAIWLGIVRVGGVVALINTNLLGEALRHAITIVAPRHVIADAELANAVAAVAPRFEEPIQIWSHSGDAHGWLRVDALRLPTPDLEYEPPTLNDRALYIYTSGTTGLPKAASVSHYRLMQWTHWFAGLVGALPEDRKVQLPADVSQRRRRGGDGRGAGRRRLCGGPRAVLG